jgi:hypothetical protein
VSILDQAVAHFEEQEVIVTEVPEWQREGEELPIIYSTPFTLSEQKRLQKLAKSDDVEFLVRVIILKAMDKNGKKLFDLSDKPTLMNRVRPESLIRVAQLLGKTDSMEEQLGN